MRTELAKQYNVRDRFKGTFIKFGTKHGYKHTETTVLFVDILDPHHQLVTDHLWFNFTKEFKELYVQERMKTGTVLSFNARVLPYVKGYHKDEIDYHLSHPRKFKIERIDPKYLNEQHVPPFELGRKQTMSIETQEKQQKLAKINEMIAQKPEGVTMVVDIHAVNGIRPYFDIYGGRSTKKTEFTENSKWCNEYRMSMPEYESYIRKKIKENPEYYNLNELRNKVIACWCITTTDFMHLPYKCHVQVLMKLVFEKFGSPIVDNIKHEIQMIQSMVDDAKEYDKYMPKKESDITFTTIHDLTRFITKKKELK